MLVPVDKFLYELQGGKLKVIYTYSEITDMLFVYGSACCNRGTKRLYLRKFFNQSHSNKGTFLAIERHFRKNGEFAANKRYNDVGRTVWTVAVETTF